MAERLPAGPLARGIQAVVPRAMPRQIRAAVVVALVGMAAIQQTRSELQALVVLAEAPQLLDLRLVELAVAVAAAGDQAYQVLSLPVGVLEQ